jgi:hypothetical protein
MSFELTALGKLRVIVIAAATMAFTTAASAESIRLIRSSQAASLNSGGVGMTVYYLGDSNLLEVVATFGDLKSAKPASQLRMSLADGDDIEFIIPGRPDVSFQFARSGSLIEVRSDPADPGSQATN